LRHEHTIHEISGKLLDELASALGSVLGKEVAVQQVNDAKPLLYPKVNLSFCEYLVTTSTQTVEFRTSLVSISDNES
jgi:hypothetical protein